MNPEASAGPPRPNSIQDPAGASAHRNRRRTAFIALGMTMLLWGSHGAFAKSLVDALPWPEVMSINIFIATAFLTVYCAASGALRDLRRFTRREVAHLALTGIIGVFLYYVLLLYAFSADRYAIQFQVLNYLFPVMTVLFSAGLVRGERLTPLRIVSVLVAFFGGYWVLTQGRPWAFKLTHWSGDLAAAAAGAAYGLFGALGKRYRAGTLAAMFIYFAASAVCAAGLFAAAPALGFHFRMPDLWHWPRILYVSIGSNCLGTIFWFRALRHSDTAVMGSLIYFTLFVSIAFFHILLQEPVYPSALIGSAFVVLGAILASLPARQDRASSAPPSHERDQP